MEKDKRKDQRRLPLEGKLKTKEIDEVFMVAICSSKTPHPSLRATFPSRGRLMIYMEQSPFDKCNFGSGR